MFSSIQALSSSCFHPFGGGQTMPHSASCSLVHPPRSVCAAITSSGLGVFMTIANPVQIRAHEDLASGPRVCRTGRVRVLSRVQFRSLALNPEGLRPYRHDQRFCNSLLPSVMFPRQIRVALALAPYTANWPFRTTAPCCRCLLLGS